MANKYLDSWDEWEKHKNGGKGHEVVEFGSQASHYAGKGGKSGKSDTYSTKADSFGRCYHKHPALKLPGTELVIHGGSCLSPIVKDADVYVGFDHGMSFSQKSWPWKKGTEFLFEIQDMSVPKDPDEFKKLVSWTRKQLEAGLKVHCGCIGGHGRTGTFFAALVADFGEPDAITYARKNYCQKAVESTSQVNFLHEHFGVKKVDGYKTGASYAASTKSSGSSSKSVATTPNKAGVESFTAMSGHGNIWEPRPA